MALLYAYNFDEASGNILDASGNGRDTVFGGSLSRSASGHTSKGITQTAPAADSAGPSITGLQTAACTLMGWVFRTDNTVIGWFGEIKSGGSGNRGILLGLSGNVGFRCRNSGGTAQTPSVAQPAINGWWHVAGTWDGANVKLFINGTQVASTALTGAPHTSGTGSHLMDTLGAETIIDDVRYYDTALDAATITTLMGTPVTAGGTSYTQTPTDTEGLTDAPRYDLGKAASDTLNLTDTATVARGIGVSAADNLPLTDAALVQRVAAQIVTDPLGITDTALVAATRATAAADSENLTDSTALILGRGITDNLGLTDQITTDRSQATSDGAGLSDSASVQLAGAGTMSSTDDLALTDTVQVTSVRTQAAADTCNLSDQIALVITRDLGDTITVTDAADLTAAFVRVFADTVALTDSVALVHGGGSHGPAVQSVLTATHTGPVLVTSQSLPDLTPSNAPSSQLEVSHGV